MPMPFFLPSQREPVVNKDDQRATTAWWRYWQALSQWVGNGIGPSPPENVTITLSDPAGASAGELSQVQHVASDALLLANASDQRGAGVGRALKTAEEARSLALSLPRPSSHADSAAMALLNQAAGVRWRTVAGDADE